MAYVIAALGFVLLVAVGLTGIARLKGTLGLVSPTSRELAVLAGAPEWWFVFGPFGVPLLLGMAALGIAHPESSWALRFYGPEKLARARARYGLELANH